MENKSEEAIKLIIRTSFDQNDGVRLDDKETAAKINYWYVLIRGFIRDMWGLEPQPAKPEYKKKIEELELASFDTWEKMKEEVGPEWYGDYNDKTGLWEWYNFQHGKHITWQQNLALMGIEKAVDGNARTHLSISSGHGVGKSCLLAWIILWFLLCRVESQVPATAPTASQMHDVLWKELSVWINKMPPGIAGIYDWTNDYVRIKSKPESWFARAKTSTKENTEALAGIHAQDVLLAIDEASGVPEQVFNTAEGALTSGNVFVVMISNPTRIDGYFYDSHNKNRQDWQIFTFNSEHSPIVDNQYIERQIKRHGRDSDEYRIRVLGKFPKEETMDDSGYIHLLPAERITVLPRLLNSNGDPLIGPATTRDRKILGIDPSGEGKDNATFALRDRFMADIIKEVKTTNPRQIANMALTFIDQFKLDPRDVVIDSFGIGADVGKEIALASKGKYESYTVLLGNRPKDEEEYNWQFFVRFDDELDDKEDDLYLNLRALMYFRLRKWLLTGGTILDNNPENSHFKDEIASNRYRRSLHGNRIQLMSKKEMQKLRIPSPNKADALALTFLRSIDDVERSPNKQRDDDDDTYTHSHTIDDPHSVL